MITSKKPNRNEKPMIISLQRKKINLLEEILKIQRRKATTGMSKEIGTTIDAMERTIADMDAIMIDHMEVAMDVTGMLPTEIDKVYEELEKDEKLDLTETEMMMVIMEVVDDRVVKVGKVQFQFAILLQHQSLIGIVCVQLWYVCVVFLCFKTFF